jgi:restriction system protein
MRFAQIAEIIEARQLKSLLVEHVGLDTLKSLPKLPPNWEQTDLVNARAKG